MRLHVDVLVSNWMRQRARLTPTSSTASPYVAAPYCPNGGRRSARNLITHHLHTHSKLAPRMSAILRHFRFAPGSSTAERLADPGVFQVSSSRRRYRDRHRSGGVARSPCRSYLSRDQFLRAGGTDNRGRCAPGDLRQR